MDTPAYLEKGETIFSVVVCTYNRADLLRGCLQSLAEQTLDQSLCEVIVVNNNSTDATQETAEEFVATNSKFRVVKEPRQGHSHARNRGYLEAKGKYIAYIDDDAKATSDWCERILTAFKTVYPPPVAVGGQIYPRYEVTPPYWFTDDFEIRTWGSEAGFLQPPRARTGFSGSNMAFTKAILLAYGGFSLNYGMVGGKLRMGEDAELFTRIYDKEPWFWYDPSIKVFHWVTKRNMKISYRFWRAFKLGEAVAYMQDKRVYLKGYPKSLLALLVLAAQLPFAALISRITMTQLVKMIEKIANYMGYVTGRINL